MLSHNIHCNRNSTKIENRNINIIRGWLRLIHKYHPQYKLRLHSFIVNFHHLPCVDPLSLLGCTYHLAPKQMVYLFKNIFWNKTAATTGEAKRSYICYHHQSMIFIFIKISHLIKSGVVSSYSIISHYYPFITKTVSMYIHEVSYSISWSTCLSLCCWWFSFYLNFIIYFFLSTITLFYFCIIIPLHNILFLIIHVWSSL